MGLHPGRGAASILLGVHPSWWGASILVGCIHPGLHHHDIVTRLTPPLPLGQHVKLNTTCDVLHALSFN